MTKISQIINSNDYPMVIVSILKNIKIYNFKIYNLIDKEYSTNKIDYDEVILKSKIFKNKRFNMIPESMLNYGIKLTAILLSNNGEKFFRKILQEGWPQLYSYIRDCNKIIYEDVAKIKEYAAEPFEMYAFYIVVLLGLLHNKRVSYETNEGKSFAQEFYKWRFSIIDDDLVLTEFNTILDESCTRTLSQIKVLPLIIKPDDEIYSFDFKFDKIFIKKKGEDESSIIGCAILKNGLETNEFYRVFEVKPCGMKDYFEYIATFKNKYSKITMNIYAMEGNVIFIS